jgi:uncharacterized protein (TIGR02600 family)
MNTASPLCWASQPGAIWNWDTNGSNTAVYKLYTSSNMVATNATYNATNDLPGTNWWSNTALYVDLNSPVVSAQTGGVTNTNYPIFDPALAMTNPATGTANSNNYVDGFTITTNANTFPGYYSNNPAAMPVTWLYILRDGSLITPDSTSTTKATFSNAATHPSQNNPIVGRIAFWTDDETCKLNINTASEGSYWATPTFTTMMDMEMGLTQPVALEYNRYPGHPASTCLSPVLWSYMGLTNPAQFLTALPGTSASSVTSPVTGNTFASTAVSTYLTNLFTNVTPRYYFGGSYAGLSNTLGGSNAISTNNLPTHPLYATVDELFFAPTNSTMTYRVSNSVGITPQQVNSLRFFLTAESRAPEVNPLNLPKLCIWPIPDPNHTMAANSQAYTTVNSSNQTIYDKTIAFCTTLGTNAYYFTRYDATSPSNDIAAGAVAGRNQINYNYLRNQFDMPIPGFAGGALTSTTKWAAKQADQIATLLYDYLRSDINLCDSYGLTNLTSVTYTWGYAYTTPPNANSLTPNPGTGQVVPIVISNPDANITRGIGRFPTIRSGLFMFIARGADQPPLMVHPDRRPMVYLSNSQTPISKYDSVTGKSYIPTNYLSNILTNTNPIAYAKINPLHPWICPQTNTNVGVLSSLVPQLMNNTSPVFSDNNPGTIHSFTNTADLESVYPIFAMVNNLGTPNGATFGSRTFPSVNTNTSMNILTSSGANSNAFTNVVNGVPTNYFYSLPTYASITESGNNPLTYSTNPNQSANGVITHAGLPYLTVQNTNTGGFDLPNPAYKDPTNPTLSPHQTRIEGVFVPDLVNVAPGSPALLPNIQIQVAGLDSITINGTPNYFQNSNNAIMLVSETNFLNLTDEASYGIGWGHTLWNKPATNTPNTPMTTPFATFTNSILLSASNSSATAGAWGGSNSDTFSFGGGTLTINLRTTNGTTIQSVNLNFPPASFPTPKIFPTATFINLNAAGWVSLPSTTYPLCGAKGINDCRQVGYLTFNANDPQLPNGATNRQNQMFAAGGRQDMISGIRDTYCFESNSAYTPCVSWYYQGVNALTADTLQSVECYYGDTRLLSCMSNIPTNCFTTNPLYGNSTPLTIGGWPFYNRNAFSMQRSGVPADCSLRGYLLAADNLGTSNNESGISGLIQQFLQYTNNSATAALSGYDTNKLFMHWNNQGSDYPGGWTGSNAYGVTSAGLPYAVPTCDFNNSTFRTIWRSGGDFDNGIGNSPDGPFVNKSDEGYGLGTTNAANANPYYYFDYAPPGASLLSPNRMVASSVIFGSLPVLDTNWDPANPTSTLTNSSWRTLQFSPNPCALATNYAASRNAAAGYSEGGVPPTNTTLPDHLLLDFLYMPVVEPYPISDPFSTAGKVNMNYRIAPFVQINRDSALRGVLKPVLMTAVDEYAFGYQKMPDSYDAGTNGILNLTNGGYQGWYQAAAPAALTNMASNSGYFCFNYPIHLNETLKQFTNRFGSNDLFRSPSEICSIWLYPAAQPTSTLPLNNTNLLATNSSGYPTNSGGTSITYTTNNANIKSWWYDHPGTTRKGLTGDNTRERPYNYLYPRLTTKSNTYQVHYRVQTLKPSAARNDYTTWVDPAAGGMTDKIVGESRGSTVVERYIEASDSTLPDFTTFVIHGGSVTNSLDNYYRFRIFNARQFTP